MSLTFCWHWMFSQSVALCSIVPKSVALLGIVAKRKPFDNSIPSVYILTVIVVICAIMC